MVIQLVTLALADDWLKAGGARALGVRASGRASYTLSDAAVDSERSDAEQERAMTLMLAEDALVHGVQLTAESLLSVGALEKLLQLALACEIDIARASTVNDRCTQPVWKYLNAETNQKPASDVAALLAQYIEAAKKKLDLERHQDKQKQPKEKKQ